MGVMSVILNKGHHTLQKVLLPGIRSEPGECHGSVSALYPIFIMIFALEFLFA